MRLSASKTLLDYHEKAALMGGVGAGQLTKMVNQILYRRRFAGVE